MPSDDSDLPILEELRELLDEHMHAPRAASRARGTRALAAAPVALGVAATLAVAVAALVLLRGGVTGHAPQKPSAPRPHRVVLPPAPPSGTNHDLSEAQRLTIRRDPPCRQRVNQGQTFLEGAPPASLLSQLGVLRRPAPPAGAATRALYREGFDVGQGVYVRYVRAARTAYGRTYFIVPVAHVTPFGSIPERCFGEFRAALGRIVAHRPAAQRRQILQAQAQRLQAEWAEAERQAGFCFASIGAHAHPPASGASMGCTPDLSDLRDPIGGGLVEGDGSGGTILAGPVADRVASVSVSYEARGGLPARTITARVINNVYVLRVPRQTAESSRPTRVVMRDRAGAVIPPATRPRVQAVTGSG